MFVHIDSLILCSSQTNFLYSHIRADYIITNTILYSGIHHWTRLSHLVVELFPIRDLDADYLLYLHLGFNHMLSILFFLLS